jgi:hypothetical protein
MGRLVPKPVSERLGAFTPTPPLSVALPLVTVIEATCESALSVESPATTSAAVSPTFCLRPLPEIAEGQAVGANRAGEGQRHAYLMVVVVPEVMLKLLSA